MKPKYNSIWQVFGATNLDNRQKYELIEKLVGLILADERKKVLELVDGMIVKWDNKYSASRRECLEDLKSRLKNQREEMGK